MKDWKSIRIKFQTAAGLPAPYSYFYTLQLTPEDKNFAVDLSLQYLDRDELDEEMILEEGFSLDDDYSWAGTLPAVWGAEITRILKKLTDASSSEEPGEQDNYLLVEIQETDGTTGTYVPDERAEWDYFQQELIQGIYEASGKERAFEMEYREIEAKNELRIEVGASFARRDFTVRLNGESPVPLAWKWAKLVMETVFKSDFMPPQSPGETPRFSGKYLTVGDGVWYEFNENLVEPSPKSKILPQIVRLMDKLREEAIR